MPVRATPMTQNIETAIEKTTAQRATRTVFALRFSWRGRDCEIVMKTPDRMLLEDALLPKARPQWRFFGAGALAQAMIVAAAVSIPLLFPDQIISLRNYVATALIPTPTVKAWKPQPSRPTKPIAQRTEAPPTFSAFRPAIPAPVATVPAIKPKTEIVRRDDTPDLSKLLPESAPSLPLGSSAIPNLKKPREEVQTGGFGDPNATPETGKVRRMPNIAPLGNYDLPPGSGMGNGTGGTKGTPGVVASAGFGNGVAVSGKAAGAGAVRQGLFSDARATGASPKLTKLPESPRRAKPVEVLFKPKPTYTDAARSRKIEGEVLLEVLFSASGQIRILQIVQGLGYGLDDAAEAAARQIRFRPAENEEGLAIDTTAVVHVVFQLAY